MIVVCESGTAVKCYVTLRVSQPIGAQSAAAAEEGGIRSRGGGGGRRGCAPLVVFGPPRPARAKTPAEAPLMIRDPSEHQEASDHQGPSDYLLTCCDL